MQHNFEGVNSKFTYKEQLIKLLEGDVTVEKIQK